eukprot:CAMPEP_0172484702 /NCGR_PEP_ID=MMETSP1066-20121228/12275_1 /TAXON_ID=671091 /ORGANISM="Coscinodiscus wailesii, Strain CCMP2513" /LENGTH=157 /DNA_ID=CAMNT_0013249395 /DNA_START=262 /DNA_END=736 /DNA_ORIENTATION=+
MRRIDRGSNYLCSYKYSSKWHDRGRLRLLRRNNGTEDRVRLETDNDDNDLVAARPTMPPSKDHPHTQRVVVVVVLQARRRTVVDPIRGAGIIHGLAVSAAVRGKLLCLVLDHFNMLRDEDGLSAGGVLNAMRGYLIQSLVEWVLKGRGRIECPVNGK